MCSIIHFGSEAVQFVSVVIFIVFCSREFVKRWCVVKTKEIVSVMLSPAANVAKAQNVDFRMRVLQKIAKPPESKEANRKSEDAGKKEEAQHIHENARS